MPEGQERYSKEEALEEAARMTGGIKFHHYESYEDADKNVAFDKAYEQLSTSVDPVELRIPQRDWVGSLPEALRVPGIENRPVAEILSSEEELIDFLQTTFPEFSFEIQESKKKDSMLVKLPSGDFLEVSKSTYGRDWRTPGGRVGLELRFAGKIGTWDGGWTQGQIPTVPDLVSAVEDTNTTVLRLEAKAFQTQKTMQLAEDVAHKLRQEVVSGFTTLDGSGGSNALEWTLEYVLTTANIRKYINLDWLDPENRKEGWLEDFVATHPLQGLRILDVGSGAEGRFCQLLEKLGASCTGLDPQAPTDSTGLVRRGDITHPDGLPEDLRNEKFDIVTSTMTFVDEVVGTNEIPKTFRFLKPGGRVIIAPGGNYRLPDQYRSSGKMTDLDEAHPYDRPGGSSLMRKIFKKTEKN